MHVVIETPTFVSDAKAAGLGDPERQSIIDRIARDPTIGVLIPGTGGARKVRFAGRGKGKSGGYRVVTFYAGQGVSVFMLNVFGKGERVDLTQQERNDLRQTLGSIADAYRRGVKNHAKRRT